MGVIEEPETVWACKIDSDLLQGECRGREVLKKQKKYIVKKVVLEKINDGWESVANLFAYFPERNGKCDKQF